MNIEEEIGKEYGMMAGAFLQLGMWMTWASLAASLDQGNLPGQPPTEEAQALSLICALQAEQCLTAGQNAIQTEQYKHFQDTAIWKYVFDFVYSNSDMKMKTGLGPEDFPSFPFDE